MSEEYKERVVVSEPDYEEEIDFKELFLRLWHKKKFIFWFCAVFAVLGLAAALLQTPKYKSSCTFVPEYQKSSTSSSISSLAAIAGINIGDLTSGSSLSPVIYPQLLQNINFTKELMRVPFDFEDYDHKISLYDLAVAENEIDEEDLLPVDTTINSFSRLEYRLSKSLSKILDLEVDKKDGYLTLSATTSEALLSAEICQAALDLMQKYITEFKLSQARESLNYIDARYEESKADYMEKQMALARYIDSNRGTLSATAQTIREQLDSDYEIAMALFTEISKQKLQAEMKVKEDTPVLSPVKPVFVPMQKVNSRTKTLIAWVFIGFVLSIISVFVLDWLREQGLNFKF